MLCPSEGTGKSDGQKANLAHSSRLAFCVRLSNWKLEADSLACHRVWWHTIPMLKRKSNTKARPSDVNQAAFQMVRMSTGTDEEPVSPVATRKRAKSGSVSDSEISRVMAAMGRRGGQIGGKRRMTTMTAEERRDVARKAAQIRWAKDGK